MKDLFMRRAQLWLSVLLVVSCAACGGGYEVNAFVPSTAFVEQLKVKAERLAKSELARFNELEAASKNELRFEMLNNPVAPAGAVYFKEYRDYTNCLLKDIRRGDSYLTPIVFTFEFKYRLMATPTRNSNSADSAHKAQADTDYASLREDSATLSYRCNAEGELVDPLPGLLPRDSALNPSWNKIPIPGRPLESPVQAPPAGVQGSNPPSGPK